MAKVRVRKRTDGLMTVGELMDFLKDRNRDSIVKLVIVNGTIQPAQRHAMWLSQAYGSDYVELMGQIERQA